MLPKVKSLNPHDQIYFLHDNLLVHKSRLVQNLLKNRKVITVINWLFLSSDQRP